MYPKIPTPKKSVARLLSAPTAIFALLATLTVASAQTPAAPAPAAKDTKSQPAAAPGPQRGGGRGAPAVKAGSQTYNTVITKLKEGKQIFSNTIIEPDLE